MNGRITVSSEPGQGSTFVLHLPLAAARALEPEEAAAAGRKVS
jgi:signal transduction histidine kinase